MIPFVLYYLPPLFPQATPPRSNASINFFFRNTRKHAMNAPPATITGTGR